MALVRHSNAYAAILALIVLAILFISFFIMMKPFSMVYDKLSPNLTGRAAALLPMVRYYWLLAPIILAIGIMLWYFTASTSDDPRYFRL
jgi:cell division protein FtsX